MGVGGSWRLCVRIRPVGERVEVHAGNVDAMHEHLFDLVSGGRLAVDQPGSGSQGDSSGADEHELVHSIRTLIGEQPGDPTSHRLAEDVRSLDPQRVLELADEIDQVSERVLLLEAVPAAPADEVRRQHPPARR